MWIVYYRDAAGKYHSVAIRAYSPLGASNAARETLGDITVVQAVRVE